ncbi:bifunctional DNA primase/polymerase, partial [bacterium]|nr:bifunctional DNA primase/polymerase [bacterium]
MNDTTELKANQFESANNLEYALHYAAKNWAVLPDWWITDGGCACSEGKKCEHPGKHPLGILVPNGVKGATVAENTIRRWWTHYPSANVSIATGRISGIVVVDVDARNGGLESLKLLEGEHGEDFRETYTIYTGSGDGSLHLYYHYPPGRFASIDNFLPGIEIKSDGKKVVAPPSNHASGNLYKVAKQKALLPLPEYFKKRPSKANFGKSRITKGQRNTTLFRLAYKMHRDGLSEDSIHEEILKAAVACDPPLSETEALTIIKSALSYQIGKHAGPEIVINNRNLAEASAEALHALKLFNDPPVLFVR